MIDNRHRPAPTPTQVQRERSSKKSSPTTAQSNFVFVLSLFLLLAVLLKTLTAVERHNIPSSPVVHAGIGFTHFQFVAHCFLLLWTYWWFFGFGSLVWELGLENLAAWGSLESWTTLESFWEHLEALGISGTLCKYLEVSGRPPGASGSLWKHFGASGSL